MNKRQLVDKVCESNGFKKNHVWDVIGAVLRVMTEALKNGEDIHLVGFGTFTTAKRKATIKFNPRTKQKMQVPQYTRVNFKPGQPLRDAVK